jgi:metallo-beta-lactamase family protein
VVFTGDYGRAGQPVLRDPEPLCAADVIISESTYGNRAHPQFESLEDELGNSVERLARRGRGRLLLPVFAVGRTQNLLYALARIFRTREVGNVAVVVDSPLATKATEVVLAHPEYFDKQALEEFARLRQGGLFSERLRFTANVDESKALNSDPRPLILLSASGMMETGRIVHHLAWNVSSEECEILVVGYQARHTLGRKLLDGASEVNLLGRRFAVRAKVTPLLGFSAHADREDLLAALSPHAQSTGALFLVHGEDDQRDPLARELRERGFQRVETPDDSRPFVF